MNVFEKIKEKLRKEKYKDREEIYTNAQCDAIRYSFGMAIDIVNQIAEEFATDTNVGNKDGWIPVSSGKLPEVDSHVIITDSNGTVFDNIWFGYAENDDKEPCFHRWDDEMYHCYRFVAVAWRYLPSAYVPPAEPDWKEHMMNRFMREN